MEHATCQAAVLDDEAGRSDVRRHLARCDECRGFADEVARIVSVAPTLYPHGAPDGLADRVVAAVAADSLNAEPASGGPSVQSSARAGRRAGLWGEVRRPLLRSTAVAAVLLLLLGVLAVARIGDNEPAGDERVLLAAATATEEAGSAEVEVQGSVSVEVPRPPDGAAPDFRGLPREMEAYFQAQWAQMMESFNRQLAEFERQVNRTMEEFNRQLEEFNRQLRSGRPGRPPTPPPPPTAPTGPGADGPRPTLPSSLDMSFSISGRGALSFAGRGALGIEGQVATTGGNVAPTSPPAPAGFRLVARGDDLVLRAPDGSWRELPRAAGPLGSVILRPDAVPRILRAATDIERLGSGHYRFQINDDRLGGRLVGEVEIGADKRVRRLAASSVKFVGDQQWDTTLVLALGGYGSARVAADAPAATGAVDLGGEAGAVIYPFGPQISATLQRP